MLKKMQMERLNRFRGIIEFEVHEEHILLRSLTVDDVFDIIQLSKNKKNELSNGVDFFSNILYKSYGNESLDDIKQFIITNYVEFVEGLVVALNWTTKEKLDESKKVEKSDKKKMSMALFKARMASEADKSTVEDKWITNCYFIMKEFKYTISEILNIQASSFNTLIEEMGIQAEREKNEMNKHKTMRK